MFTGIIETLATIQTLTPEGDNLHICVASPISRDLHVDQSVAHDGVCLTVTHTDEQTHTVTAIRETLQRTNLGQWKPGTTLNLERCMPASGRFDGHIVQGHVDTTTTCLSIAEENGSWRFTFQLPPQNPELLVEKGSITINGVSLTVAGLTDDAFEVAIIPYTYAHTNFQTFRVGSLVNLEFDIIGKYVQRILQPTLKNDNAL
ncbi:MAG: riboflavin synthase [Bernardetiaceae bacterium]